VARDAAGHRLVNRPPFITHHPASAAALRAGQPVAMACCWNGLAVLRGRPFAGPRGLRFRAGQPGECRASEASLLCDDFARSGLAHVVMDPGVRLAYELQQVDLLGGTAATAGGGDKAAAAGSGRLQPRLSWQQVVGTSAALAARAAQQQQQQTQTQRYVECCDLLPGRSYVDFRHSCHMVDTAAHNYTADAFA
jgi:alpha-1,3-mannosyltransferase